MRVFIIFLSLTIISVLGLNGETAFSAGPEILEVVCLSRTQSDFEIRLKVSDHQVIGVSFAKNDWSQKGGPFFPVTFSEANSGPAFARYTKVGKESAFVDVARPILDGSSGVVVSDGTPYNCSVDNQQAEL